MIAQPGTGEARRFSADPNRRSIPLFLDSFSALRYSSILFNTRPIPFAEEEPIKPEDIMAPKKKSPPKKAAKAAKKSVAKPAPKAAAKPAKSAKPIMIAKVPKKKVRIDPAFQPLLAKLQNRRNEITGQVNHLEQDLREEIADNQNIPGDMADHGSGELTQHLSVTLMENDRIELERIEKAIGRIEEGNYGQCEVCQKPIPMARLKAIPWATKCINCQSRFEGA